ncbi:bifunctional P-loop containing nucleoside triphosphate hydrolase/Helicase [Babesia duncani]|uniref:ATP-dependent RNA helicase n=1 Tax=Babesia duncani TaxID=323732 RepID=A0AAD9PL67_9APIC|nr:bifunctional P-loop containing nucleoside triphosphate hydrolase/Helicase [Babesia duncani]
MSRRGPLLPLGRLSRNGFKSDPFDTRGYYKQDCRSHADEGHQTPNLTRTAAVRIHAMLQHALAKNFGISQLNKIQESCYMSIVSGKDTTVHAPVGTGKTLSYLLPIINNIYNIHDMLEHLLLSKDSTGPHGNHQSAILQKSLSWTRRVPHALLPQEFTHFKQDQQNLQRDGEGIMKNEIEKSTMEKLVDVCTSLDPRQLAQSRYMLPRIPHTIWRRKSKNAVYRSLMKNPLGSVRCTVIVVPTKDLVAQVLGDVQSLDIMGRVTVQTLTTIHHAPPLNVKGIAQDELAKIPESQPFYPTMHAAVIEARNATPPSALQLSESQQPKVGILSAQDEREMLEKVPVVETVTKEIELVTIGGGRRRVLPSRAPASTQMQRYGLDGLTVDKVEYVRHPVLEHPNIQWGSVDLVVTTPHLFFNDIYASTQRGLGPVCVVFDEIDSLLENNASRACVMEIVSRLRPRPLTFNPLIHNFKRPQKRVAPCQFIHVASTMNFGGPQTCGSMLSERFNTANFICDEKIHDIQGLDWDLIDVGCIKGMEFSTRLKALLKLLPTVPACKILIYLGNLKDLWTLYAYFKEHKWPVMAIHSRSTLATRLSLLRCMHDSLNETAPKANILLATDLCSRGIRIPNVQHIVHLHMPTNAATFLHRIKNSSAKITCMVGNGDWDLVEQLVHCFQNAKATSQLLSRKRSFKRRLYGRNSGFKSTKSDSAACTPCDVVVDTKNPAPPIPAPCSRRYNRIPLKDRIHEFENVYKIT